MDAKTPVVLLVLVETARLRWFVASLGLDGRATPLLRSEVGDLEQYLGLPVREEAEAGELVKKKGTWRGARRGGRRPWMPDGRGLGLVHGAVTRPRSPVAPAPAPGRSAPRAPPRPASPTPASRSVALRA